jgi:hypothetical protein
MSDASENALTQSKVFCYRNERSGVTAMTIDALEKAAECDREIEACVDPSRRATLTHLRHTWTKVAADMASGRDDWRGFAESAERLHSDAFHNR